MSDNSYRTIVKTPEFHFDDGYTGTFEITEEGRKALDELIREHDADTMHFFRIFERDLVACINGDCKECSFKEVGICGREVLIDNVRRLVDNQKRMLIAFNKQWRDNDRT